MSTVRRITPKAEWHEINMCHRRGDVSLPKAEYTTVEPL